MTTASSFGESLSGEALAKPRGLQLEFVSRLAGMLGDAGGDKFDYLSRSMALTKLKAIQKTLSARNGGNAETQAHTAHVLFVIEQVLKPKP